MTSSRPEPTPGNGEPVPPSAPMPTPAPTTEAFLRAVLTDDGVIEIRVLKSNGEYENSVWLDHPGKIRSRRQHAYS